MSETTVHGARFRDAIAIVEPGACNPSGICHSIIDACKEIREHEPQTSIREDAAVRLMVYQLAHLIEGVGADISLELYQASLAHCRSRAAELGVRLYGAS